MSKEITTNYTLQKVGRYHKHNEIQKSNTVCL